MIPYSLGEYDALALFVQTELDDGSFSNHISSYLSKHFPPYMLPSQIQCQKSLPQNSNGKVDRAALLEKACSFQFAQNKKNSENLSIGQIITEIWESILKTKIKSSQTTFFDYGGNSIQIYELYETLKNQLQVDFSITDLFSNPSIHDQTKLFEDLLL